VSKKRLQRWTAENYEADQGLDNNMFKSKIPEECCVNALIESQNSLGWKGPLKVI